MAAENRFVVFVLISFNGIEGILKDKATTIHKTQKCSKKVVKVFSNYNLSIICLAVQNLRVIATSYKQRATNCHSRVCLLTLHDHKQQLTFLQRFKLIVLYPA